MRRSQLEHLLRAAARVINESELLVIGSQSILGTFSDDQLPREAVRSMEADLAALNDPDDRKADQIDGAIGEGSRFHETFGACGASRHPSLACVTWSGEADHLASADRLKEKASRVGPPLGLQVPPHDPIASCRRAVGGAASRSRRRIASAQSSGVSSEVSTSRS